MLEINKEQLIKGKEYYLECLTYGNDNITLIPLDPPYKMIARFDRLDYKYPTYPYVCFNNFRHITNKNCKSLGYGVHLNSLWRFYEIIEDKIQTDMENRAITEVLKLITGDEYFRYQ
jgi:hypothetical protein